jgi:hypothetical protein
MTPTGAGSKNSTRQPQGENAASPMTAVRTVAVSTEVVMPAVGAGIGAVSAAVIDNELPGPLLVVVLNALPPAGPAIGALGSAFLVQDAPDPTMPDHRRPDRRGRSRDDRCRGESGPCCLQGLGTQAADESASGVPLGVRAVIGCMATVVMTLAAHAAFGLAAMIAGELIPGSARGRSSMVMRSS